MSSLPPYNPRIGDRAVWLLPVTTHEDLPPTWPAGWTAAAVDDVRLAAPVAALCGLPDVAVASSVGDVAVPGDGWLLVVGAPGFTEAVLRHLMSMPAGTARFAMLPGARSVVQLMSDRAVLLRLNEGRALAGLA